LICTFPTDNKNLDKYLSIINYFSIETQIHFSSDQEIFIALNSFSADEYSIVEKEEKETNKNTLKNDSVF